MSENPVHINWRFANYIMAIGTILISTAAAQAQVASSSDESSGTLGKGVEEIVVTAQRRSENLQTVPISVSAVSGETLNRSGINNLTDLPVLVPSLAIPQGIGLGTPALRGVGTFNAVLGDESPVATYIDGVYVQGYLMPLFAFNNVERIEVLQGPQGTLFGRNATGGVIQIVTKNPQQNPSLNASVGYGNFNSWETGFYATTGITSTLSADLAFYRRDQQDGWGKNIATGDDIYRERSLAIRNKWHLELGDATDATLAGSYFRIRNDSAAQRAIPGARTADGSPFPGFYNVNMNFDIPKVAKATILSFNIGHNLSWGRLVSITSWQRYRQNGMIDGEYGPLPILDLSSWIPETTWTQELQLLSLAESKIRWVVGLYYLDDKTELDPLNTSGLAIPVTALITHSRLRSTAVASYAQATAPLWESTRITAGLRYSRDERKLDAETVAIVGPLSIPSCGPQPACPYDKQAHFGSWSYRVSIDHDLTKDIMLYGSYNRGFKSGNFALVAPGNDVVRPETIDAYEIGVKSFWLGKRLRMNGSIFWYDYRNFQVSTVDQSGLAFETNAPKARIKGADMDFEFVPIEHLTFKGGGSYLNAKFVKFPNAQFTLPNTTIPPFFGNMPPSAGDASGNWMPYAPRWSVNFGILYEISSNIGLWRISTATVYKSKAIGRDFSGRLRLPSYSTTNAALAWTSSNDKWTAKIWANNIFDRKYVSFIATGSTDTAQPAAPRTYGITLGVKLQ